LAGILLSQDVAVASDDDAKAIPIKSFVSNRPLSCESALFGPSGWLKENPN